MSIPTHEDAHLLVKIFRLRLEPFMQESETWFTTQLQLGPWEEMTVRYPVSSKEWRMLTTVLGYWEMLGALIDHNLLSDDLLFDTMETMDITWQKVRDWLPTARADMGPELWENIDLLIARQARWRNTRLPKALRT
jgi:hypothetical protein